MLVIGAQINIRILQTMISGIPLTLGLGTRMSAPSVYVVSWGPMSIPQWSLKKWWQTSHMNSP